MRPAVFLDRDDTLLDTNRVTASEPTPGDLFDPARAALLPGVAHALAALKKAGYTLVVFTSQGGIARASGTLRDFEAVNDALRDLLTRQTGDPDLLTAVYGCPFHPKGHLPPFNREHPWRKPAPAMITAAAAELGLDLARSWAVGDKPRDTQSAAAAGIPPARCILIGPDPQAHAPDLAAAARLVLG